MGGAIALCQGNLPDMVVETRVNEVSYILRSREERFLMMFKREYYKSFKFHFPWIMKPNGRSYGYAQIMSKSLIDFAVNSNVDWILFVTPDERMYKCPPALFKKFCENHKTEVPHLKGEVAMPLDYFDSVR